MIPPGYLTLPEALDIIQACIDDDDLHVLQGPPDPRSRRWAAIQGLADEIWPPEIIIRRPISGIFFGSRGSANSEPIRRIPARTNGVRNETKSLTHR